MFRTLIDAVQTQVTFGLMPGRPTDWVVAALAAKKATIAIIAMLCVLDEAEHRPARHKSEEGP